VESDDGEDRYSAQPVDVRPIRRSDEIAVELCGTENLRLALVDSRCAACIQVRILR
jgi:hypothetical protein